MMEKQKADAQSKKQIIDALDRSSDVPLATRIDQVRAWVQVYDLDQVINKSRGENPLMMACDGFNEAEFEMVKLLVELGADVNFCARSKRRILDAALHPNDDTEYQIVGSLNVAKYLFDKGARFGQARRHQLTCSDVRVFRFYLEQSEAKGFVDTVGNILHSVVRTERIALVKELLEPSLMGQANKDGLTPLGMARQLRVRPASAAIIAVLVDAGAPESVELTSSFDSFLLPVDRFKAVAEEVSKRLHPLFENPPPTGQNLAMKLQNRPHQETLEIMEHAKEALGDSGVLHVLAGDQSFKTRFFHHGDLNVEGSLYVESAFMVTGTLRVSGGIRDCGPDSTVVVGGDVFCESLSMSGEFHVAGDLIAEKTVEGIYNDNTLIATRIRAKKVIYNDHCILGDVEIG